jgi:hypothetical protein
MNRVEKIQLLQKIKKGEASISELTPIDYSKWEDCDLIQAVEISHKLKANPNPDPEFVRIVNEFYKHLREKYGNA